MAKTTILPWYRSTNFKVALAATILGGLVLFVIQAGFGLAKSLFFHEQQKSATPTSNVSQLEVYRSYSFSAKSGWDKTGEINDLVISEGQTLELADSGYSRQIRDKTARPNAVRDPQGYIQTPIDLSENSFVCSKILSHTPEIDFSTRLNRKLQVITGDGDNRSIALKLVATSSGQSGGYQAPDPPTGATAGYVDSQIDRLGRFRLSGNLPIGKEFVTCLSINAPRGGQGQRVTVELVVLDGSGHTLDLGRMPKWSVETPGEINGTNRFSIGLIDSRQRHPMVEVRGFCAVTMQGDQPTDREKDACLFP